MPNTSAEHACRPGCGACCIAPSISTLSKPPGVPCQHLDEAMLCRIFGQPERPACCGGLQPSLEMCGETREYALHWLATLEILTQSEPLDAQDCASSGIRR